MHQDTAMPVAEASPSKPPTVARIRKASKTVGQILSALKNSKEPEGPTMTQIFKFITTSLMKPSTKRQVIMALKRSVEFGILKRHKGHYLISDPDDLTKSVLPAVNKITSNIRKPTYKLPKKPIKHPRLSSKVRRNHRFCSLLSSSFDHYPTPPVCSTIQLPNVKVD